MKKLILFFFLLTVTISFSQKMKVLEGDFKNLKEIKNYYVVFDYKDVMIPDFDSEEDFLKDKMLKREKKETGAGEVFKKSWLSDRENKYHPEFIDAFNFHGKKKGLHVSENSDDNFIMKVHTLTIYPGYNVGIVSKASYVDTEISIYKKEYPDTLLLKVLYPKSYGSTAYNAGDRIARCYNTLAIDVLRSIKKKALK